MKRKTSDQSLLEETLSKSVFWLFGWFSPTFGTLRAFGLPDLTSNSTQSQYGTSMECWGIEGSTRGSRVIAKNPMSLGSFGKPCSWERICLYCSSRLLVPFNHDTGPAGTHPWESRSGRHAIASTLQKGPIYHGCIKPTGTCGLDTTRSQSWDMTKTPGLWPFTKMVNLSKFMKQWKPAARISFWGWGVHIKASVWP
jgi:hypothetical protein